MIFAGNQYAALLHDVGGKTTSISSSQDCIKARVIQYRRTCFFVPLLPCRLTSQQSQFTVSLTPRNAKEAELLNTMQRRPGINVFSVITQGFTRFLADLASQTTPVNVLTDVFRDVACWRTFARVYQLRLKAWSRVITQLLAVFTNGKLTQQSSNGAAIFFAHKTQQVPVNCTVMMRLSHPHAIPAQSGFVHRLTKCSKHADQIITALSYRRICPGRVGPAVI
ncbi:Uncharacterised protein [Salmonella enterica subsp. enterica serovar Typhi]|nr:Uncharacterised protein [Salmonella enterica subsp. enterica serovar Typhi]CXD65592.1 Uncharacterised protein [Salmonella enterica subsp. enterica serovar Typhi]